MKRKRKNVETRTDAVEQARRSLLSRGWPRLQMSLILILTGCAGFLLSTFLLDAGLRWMWLRYPLMILFSYGVFLLLLGAWLQLQQAGGLDVEADDFDVIDTYYFQSGGGSGRGWFSGSGGSSSGGRSSLFGGFDLDLDADDGCAVLLAVIALVAAVIGALVVSFYVIYAAPALLAEILVDSLLLAGLYKRLKHVERKHWLSTAFRRTWLPLVSVLLLFTLAGYAIQRAVPEAHSIGDFWKHITHTQRSG